MKLPPWQRVVPLLKFATKVVDKIPTREDTWPQRIAKLLSLVDAGQEVYSGARSKMWELRQRYGLVERDSETFVRLFFATTLRDFFSIHRETLDEHNDLIEARAPDGERIFFLESQYSGYRSEFYATKGVDFAKVIDRLWSAYPDGIYISVSVEPGDWRKQIMICEVPPVPADRLSRGATERLRALTATHRSYVIDKTHRCYFLYGDAGAGKTTFEVLFARNFGGRALMLDATSLPHITMREWGFLIDTMRPKFLIIDDIDRAPIGDVSARILFLLVRLKSHFPEMTLLLSANDPTKLDPAMFRSGRIDVPIRMTAPTEEETVAMVASLLAAHGVPEWKSTRAVVDRIVQTAVDVNLAHADIDGLCLRLKHEDVEAVLANVRLLKKLADDANGCGGLKDKPNGAPPG